MSNDNPTPPAPEPYQQPNTQPAAAEANYAQPVQYAPRPARPPLTKRGKTGAAWAGIIGFNLLTLGFFVFFVPLALLALGSVVVAIVRNAQQQGSADIGPDVIRALENFDPTAWVLPLLIISAVGLVIWIVALVISRAILRSTGAVRPWGITWAAAGIAIVAYWIISTIVSFFSGLISALATGVAQSAGDEIAIRIAMTVISIVVAILINSIIGWLAWLWMAHAMRPSEQEPAVQQAATQE